MAKRDDAAKSNAVAKAAFENPGLSDFRKERATFKTVIDLISEDGELKPDHTGAICGAVLLDLVGGRIDNDEAGAIIRSVDTVLKKESQAIQREVLALQLEMRGRISRKTSSGDPRLYAQIPPMGFGKNV